MNRKILISIAVAVVALAALSTFLESSRNVSGKLVVPAFMNVYSIITFIVLVSIATFIIFRK